MRHDWNPSARHLKRQEEGHGSLCSRCSGSSRSSRRQPRSPDDAFARRGGGGGYRGGGGLFTAGGWPCRRRRRDTPGGGICRSRIWSRIWISGSAHGGPQRRYGAAAGAAAAGAYGYYGGGGEAAAITTLTAPGSARVGLDTKRIKRACERRSGPGLPPSRAKNRPHPRVKRTIRRFVSYPIIGVIENE